MLLVVRVRLSRFHRVRWRGLAFSVSIYAILSTSISNTSVELGWIVHIVNKVKEPRFTVLYHYLSPRLVHLNTCKHAHESKLKGYPQAGKPPAPYA